MTHRPYPETPEAAVRNGRVAQVLDLIDQLVGTNDAHGRRARVRVAGLYSLSSATEAQVRDAVRATRPVEPPTFVEPTTEEQPA